MNINNFYPSRSHKLKFLLISLMTTVTACSSQYTVSTNLDKENFQNYFSHSQVKIVENESEFDSRFKLIGMVEGQDCQVKPHHAEPNEITARTQARRKAFELQANAIIFTGCALINDDKASKQCTSTLVCYGKAYLVEQSNNVK